VERWGKRGKRGREKGGKEGKKSGRKKKEERAMGEVWGDGKKGGGIWGNERRKGGKKDKRFESKIKAGRGGREEKKERGAERIRKREGDRRQ